MSQFSAFGPPLVTFWPIEIGRLRKTGLASLTLLWPMSVDRTLKVWAKRPDI